MSFDFAPKKVDLSTGAKQITVTVRVTDATGLDGSPTIIISSTSTSQTQGFGSMARTSGSAQDGTYAKTITMPDNVAPGAWDVALYPLSDTLGNRNGGFTTHPEKLMVRYGDSVPTAPLTVQAAAGNASATVSWSAPASDQPIGSYTVTSTPGGLVTEVDGSVTTATVEGLTNGTAYTFRVVATSSVGDSLPSAASNSVTPATLPGAPTSVVGTPGNGSVRLNWVPPASNGGAPVTGYIATVLPGGHSVQFSGSATAGTLTDLSNGVEYTFTMVALNKIGESSASDSSAPVTPAGPPGRVGMPAAKVAGKNVTLTWVEPEENGTPITGYVVRWAGKSKSVAATKTSLVVKALKPGKYRFAINAVSAAGSGATSPVKVVKIR
jgi:hypothetical protein